MQIRTKAEYAEKVERNSWYITKKKTHWINKKNRAKSKRR